MDEPGGWLRAIIGVFGVGGLAARLWQLAVEPAPQGLRGAADAERSDPRNYRKGG